MIVHSEKLIALPTLTVWLPMRELERLCSDVSSQLGQDRIMLFVTKNLPGITPLLFHSNGLVVNVAPSCLEASEYNNRVFFLGDGYTICNRKNSWEIVVTK